MVVILPDEFSFLIERTSGYSDYYDHGDIAHSDSIPHSDGEHSDHTDHSNVPHSDSSPHSESYSDWPDHNNVTHTNVDWLDTAVYHSDGASESYHCNTTIGQIQTNYTDVSAVDGWNDAFTVDWGRTYSDSASSHWDVSGPLYSGSEGSGTYHGDHTDHSDSDPHNDSHSDWPDHTNDLHSDWPDHNNVSHEDWANHIDTHSDWDDHLDVGQEFE